MSAPSLTERPIFASEENEYLTPERPPVSRLAIVSFIGGLFSLIALFNINLIAICFLAVTLALATYLFIAGTSRSVVRTWPLPDWPSGSSPEFVAIPVPTFAMITLCVGQEHGGRLRQRVAQNKLLEAYELTRPEPERQVRRHVARRSLQANARTQPRWHRCFQKATRYTAYRRPGTRCQMVLSWRCASLSPRRHRHARRVQLINEKGVTKSMSS